MNETRLGKDSLSTLLNRLVKKEVLLTKRGAYIINPTHHFLTAEELGKQIIVPVANLVVSKRFQQFKESKQATKLLEIPRLREPF